MQNPFQNLFVFNASNDINQNFLKTLETLISFNKENVNHLINIPIERKIYTKFSSFDHSDKIFKQLQSEGKINIKESTQESEPTIEIIQTSHIGDFLIFKLIENLRRLYSANKQAGKTFPKFNKGTSIEELTLQQSLIYDAFQLIKPHIKFDNSLNFFKGSFLGEDKYCNKSDLFFFLSFHENLTTENHEKHLSLFKEFFSEYSLDDKLLVDNLITLSYPNLAQKEMKSNIALLSDSFYEELIQKFSKKDFLKIGALSLDLFIEMAIRKIAAPSEVKTFYFSRLLNNKNYFSEKNFSNAEIEALSDYLADSHECTNLITRNLNSTDNRNNYFVNFCLEIIPALKDEPFLINVLRENFSPGLTQKIIAKYDLSDEFVFNFCSGVLKINGSHQILKNLVLFADDRLSSNSLLNILALDVNLIEHLNSIILKRQLGNELFVNENRKNLVKNIKI